MSTRNVPSRHPGEPGGLTIDGRPVPFLTGVLPKDFVQRLIRLKEASGLTWNAFARALGVDKKQMRRWRRGTEPCGGAMLSLIRLASHIPGGVAILLGEHFQMGFWEE